MSYNWFSCSSSHILIPIRLVVPSAQAGNCFIDALSYKLKHSSLEGFISFKRSLSFPHDSERGKLLRPTYELTYEYLASRNFDPHATVSLALEYQAG